MPTREDLDGAMPDGFESGSGLAGFFVDEFGEYFSERTGEGDGEGDHAGEGGDADSGKDEECPDQFVDGAGEAHDEAAHQEACVEEEIENFTAGFGPPGGRAEEAEDERGGDGEAHGGDGEAKGDEEAFEAFEEDGGGVVGDGGVLVFEGGVEGGGEKLTGAFPMGGVGGEEF